MTTRSSKSLVAVWLPTALGATTLMAEIPLITASVARFDDGGRALAALGVAISIIVVANSPGLALAPLVVATPHHRIGRYALGVGAAAGLVLFLLAFLPVTANAIGGLLRLDAPTTGQLRLALFALAPASVAVAWRRYLHGRLILFGQTGQIVTATLARLAGSGLTAWLALAWLPVSGALAGGAALTVGAFTETAVLAWTCRSLTVPTSTSDERRFGDVVRMHAHLSSTRLLNMVPSLATTIGIAYAVANQLSLIVWPVLYGLVSFFTGPLSDLEAVTAASLKKDPAGRDPRRLARWLVFAFGGAFAVVCATPIIDGYLGDLMAVPADAAALGGDGAILLALVPPLWVLRGYLRGHRLAAGRGRLLSQAAAGHVVMLVSALGLLTLTPLPGVAVAAVALNVGLIGEVAMLSALSYLPGFGSVSRSVQL